MVLSLLKPQAVADALGISRRQAYQLMQQGDIPTVRIGRRSVRVRPQDLELYIQSNLSAGTLVAAQMNLVQPDTVAVSS